MLDKNLLELKGIGEKTIVPYHKLGLYTYQDLLFYYPRDYMKFEPVQAVSDSLIGRIISFEARICKRPLMRRANRLQIVSTLLKQEETFIAATWFHMPYLTKSLKAGELYVFRGTLIKKGNQFAIEQPAIYKKEQYEKLLDTLQPVYALTKGLSNTAVSKEVKQLFSEIPVQEMKQLSYLIEYGKEYLSIDEALRQIHFPKDEASLFHARKTLVFDEFLLFMLRLLFLKEDNAKAKNDFQIFPSAYAKRLMEALPYQLTNAQKRVFEEIEADLMKPHSMSRLVQGDVGCGKTIVALLALITVGHSGYQTAMMAPTEILAKQHFESISEMLRKYQIPLKTCLLTGSMTQKQKRDVYAQIEAGDVQIVIGTHALIQEKVIYHSLALVITDEQHRFGVRQREQLVSKNKENVPHVLVMSATPIPRTLAIIMYGDLDISIIDEVPAKRLPIKNCVVNTSYRQKAYHFIEKEIATGHQAYIICPLVEESEALDVCDVISYTEKLREIFPDTIQIAYLHGKMKAEQKESVMNAYYNNHVQILVSTTVVEVGVNVPNATVMMVENAERFGLSQLHQLRGRIGRGDCQSYCIFINGNENEHSKKRLETLNKSNDGFFIASEDLKLRGPGDLFGIRQSGDMQFRLGDVFSDLQILKEASEYAKELLADDPGLEKPEHRALKEQLVKAMQFDHAQSL